MLAGTMTPFSGFHSTLSNQYLEISWDIADSSTFVNIKYIPVEQGYPARRSRML